MKSVTTCLNTNQGMQCSDGSQSCDGADVLEILTGQGYVTKEDLKAIVDYYYGMNRPQIAYKSLEEALKNIKGSVQSEYNDQVHYDQLIAMAPESHKAIIKGIRDEEQKHDQMLRGIYYDITGERIMDVLEPIQTREVKDYGRELVRALQGEDEAAKRYVSVRAGLPNEYYRDMLLEIITDELTHADKYNYLIHDYATGQSDMNQGYAGQGNMEILPEDERSREDMLIEEGYLEDETSLPVPEEREKAYCENPVEVMEVHESTRRGNGVVVNGRAYRSYYDYYQNISKL